MGGVKEECGVFGIWSNDPNVAKEIYYGLVSLQHRGQEAAGIAVCDTTGQKGNMCVQKGMGLVSEVFDEKVLSGMTGNIGVGHVRYSTTGESSIQNAQPLAFQYLKGTLALVHNGNIVNAAKLKEDLFKEGSVFSATTDSEVIATLIAKKRASTGSIEEAVKLYKIEILGNRMFYPFESLQVYVAVFFTDRTGELVASCFGILLVCLFRR